MFPAKPHSKVQGHKQPLQPECQHLIEAVGLRMSLRLLKKNQTNRNVGGRNYRYKCLPCPGGRHVPCEGTGSLKVLLLLLGKLTPGSHECLWEVVFQAERDTDC